MDLTRTVILGVVGGALAAWLAAAATSGTHQIVSVPPMKPAAIDASGAQLAAEIARLHDHLHPTVAPQEPARNLFEFGAARAPQIAAAAPTPVVEPPKPVAPEPPPLTLIGVAEDPGAAGGTPVRTAIISGRGQLFLVKEGEVVASRYRVTSIGADAVDLTEATDGSLLHLVLK